MISEFNQIDEKALHELLQQHWGIDADISQLPSYSDKNFRLRCGEREFVAKLANPDWNYADLDFENQALLHLQNQQLPLQLPRVQHSLCGQHLLALPVVWRGQTQQTYLRLLSFVPGVTYQSLASQLIQQDRYQDLTQLEISLGQSVAAMTLGLADFNHSQANRMHDWNLLRLADLRANLAWISESKLHQQLELCLNLFEQELALNRNELPMQVIHNDANDLNLIVSQTKVTGLIDFGDMCHSLRVADLAIAITYALQFSCDARASLLTITRAYLQRNRLSLVELKMLLPCVLGRLSQSILLAAQAAHEQPENAFAQVSQKAVRAMLHEFAQLDRVSLERDLLQLLN